MGKVILISPYNTNLPKFIAPASQHSEHLMGFAIAANLLASMNVYFDFKKALEEASDGSFMLAYQGTLFPFKWKITGHEKTVFFMPGATSRAKPIPSFQRSSYFDKLPYNCISCFDPTLFYSPSLSIAWFQGYRDAFFASMLGDLSCDLMDAINTKGENVLIYATSAGGIPGFHVASRLKDAQLYVGNIQTNASEYFRKNYAAMADVSYPDDKLDDVTTKHAQRIAVSHIDAPFHLTYAQNEADQLHYQRHFLPFAKEAAKKQYLKSSFFTYFDEEAGHNPPTQHTELKIIRCLQEGIDLSDQVSGFKKFELPLD
jgi:hypothetical protein